MGAFIVEAGMLSNCIIEDCPFGQTLADEVEAAFGEFLELISNVGSQVVNIDACVDVIKKVVLVLEHCPEDTLNLDFLTELPDLMLKLQDSVRGALGDVDVESRDEEIINDAVADARDIVVTLQ